MQRDEERGEITSDARGWGWRERERACLHSGVGSEELLGAVKQLNRKQYAMLPTLPHPGAATPSVHFALRQRGENGSELRTIQGRHSGYNA